MDSEKKRREEKRREEKKREEKDCRLKIRYVHNIYIYTCLKVITLARKRLFHKY